MKELISEMEQFMSVRTLRTFSSEELERITHLAELCFIFRAEFESILVTTKKDSKDKPPIKDDKSANPVMRFAVSMLNSQCTDHPDGHGIRNLKATSGLRHWLCEIYRVEKEAEECIP